MSRRLKIGVDIDGTVYPWTEAVNAAVMSEFGLPDPGLHTSWDYLKNLLTEEQFAWIWTAEAASQVFGASRFIYDGAAEVLNALAIEHDVHFVTHRNPVLLTKDTGSWLNAHFAGYRGVHVLANTVKKSDVLGWDIFIDDKVETVDEMLDETDALALIPMRDWNAEYGRAALRFNHWSEVADLIRPLAWGMS